MSAYPKIYIASKLRHADKWRDLEKEYPAIKFCMRWPSYAKSLPDEEPYVGVIWSHFLEDIKECDGVILYAEPGDNLRGALVECGMAIALGKFVIVIGTHEGYGTWQYHRSVYKASSIEQALHLVLVGISV